MQEQAVGHASEMSGVYWVDEYALDIEVRSHRTNRAAHDLFSDSDADVIGGMYPKIGAETVRSIAGCLDFPRLLEVLGLAEAVHRYVTKDFSAPVKSGPDSTETVIIPLSILFWNKEEALVQRTFTPQTLLLSASMEGLASCSNGLRKLNLLLKENYNASLAIACGGCVVVAASEDIPKVLSSKYGNYREGLAREADANPVLRADSVNEVPGWVLEATVDFGEREVRSHSRFAANALAVLEASPAEADHDPVARRGSCYLGGSCMCPCSKNKSAP